MKLGINNSATSTQEQGGFPSDLQLAGGMRLSKWIKIVGISKMTAWRWRKEGKLDVGWRYGLPWVTAETIQKFFTDDGTAPRRRPCRQTPNQRGRRVAGLILTAPARCVSSPSSLS